MMEIVVAAGTAALTAAVYGGYAYLSGRLSKPNEEFSKPKLIGTVLVAGGVGLVFNLAGLPVEEASLVGILATVGATEIGQKIVKPFWNWITKPTIG